jgi:hypothetical protein
MIPAMPTLWMPTEEVKQMEEESVVLLEEHAHQYSVQKTIKCFYLIGSVTFMPPKKAVYPFLFQCVLSNPQFVDQYDCNPHLKVAPVDGQEGRFNCVLESDPGRAVVLVRFMVNLQFPANRIPMRVVPSTALSSLEFVYEMNPIVEEIEKLVVEVGCAELTDKAMVAGLKSTKTGAVFPFEVDTHNRVIRFTVEGITKEKRRDKILISCAPQSKVTWKGCSLGFECKRKMLTQVKMEIKSHVGVHYLKPVMHARNYFSK